MDNATNERAQTDQVSPPTYRQLAEKIARRTTDGIVIALIVAGLLTIARHASQWWDDARTDWDANPAQVELPAVDDSQQPIVQFAASSREQARARAIAHCDAACRQILADPATKLSGTLPRQELSVLTPCGTGLGFSLYESPAELLCIYGVRTASSAKDAEEPLAVLTTVIALPTEPGQWTLVTTLNTEH